MKTSKYASTAIILVFSAVANAQVPFYDAYRQRSIENQQETLRNLEILRLMQELQRQQPQNQQQDAGLGSHCVTASATIGALIRFQDGRFGTVQRLSGGSNICVDPAFPIRALVTFN